MDLTSIVRDIDHWLREAVGKLNYASDLLNKVRLDLQKLVLLLLPLPATLTEQLLRLADILAGVGTLAPGGDDLLTLSNRMDIISAKLDLALHEIDSTHYNVILPPTAPAGYGGGASASDVWDDLNHIWEPSQGVYYDIFSQSYLLGALYIQEEWRSALQGLPFPGNPDFLYIQSNVYGSLYQTHTINDIQAHSPSVIDWSLWDGSESLVAFLNAHETTYGGNWTSTGPGSVVNPNYAWYINPTYGTGFRCRWPAHMLPILSGRGFGSVAGAVAPIWPGLGNVTLGTPVAIAGTMRVEAVMDGCLVDITTPPTGTGKRLLGTSYYDYGVGEAAFENDDGYLEMWQYLGFRTMLLVPKAMVQASAIQFRLLGGAEGTLTPWTVAA